MSKPGIKKLVCGQCGATREVEAGIRIMFCCAEEMKEESEEEEPAEEKPNQ